MGLELSARAPAEKQQALRELAEKRKHEERRRQTSIPGYKPLADYHNGAYECDYVSPWSKSAHNVDAELLIVGHDWSSSKWLAGPFDRQSAERGYSDKFATNRNLFDLLKRHFNLCFADVYATNVFPFVKQGKSQGSIPVTEMRAAACKFLRPQIEIIEPTIVICLGKATFNSLRVACDLRPATSMVDAIDSPFVYRESTIYAVAHTGTLGINNRTLHQVEKDWTKLRSQFDKLRAVS